MTLTTAKDQSDVLKLTAINYKSILQDTLLKLTTKIQAVGKWDKEFGDLFYELSSLITTSTQTIEEKAVDLSAELAKVK